MSGSAKKSEANEKAIPKVRYRWQMVNRRNPKACVVRAARPDAAKQDLKRFVEENRLEYRHQRRDGFDDFADLFSALRLNEDEELLDRAERRDLPASVQLAALSRKSTKAYDTTDTTATSAQSPRSRAVSNRRSAVPDTLYDDYAYRLSNQGSELRTRDRGSHNQDLRRRPIVGRSTSSLSRSYMSLVTYDDCFPDRSALEDDLMEEAYHLNSSKLPDLVVDDVLNRKIRQSTAAQVSPPPPPFGIPKSPLSCIMHTVPEFNYASVEPDHSQLKVRYRTREPEPDLIFDDLAVRTLRKDYHLGYKVSDDDLWQGQYLSRSASTTDLAYRDLRITLKPTLKPSSITSSAASNSSTAASPTFDSSSP